ncbi:MAG: type II secretion system protein GspM [Comamonas sp.]|jgi:general secretion pathway protein M
MVATRPSHKELLILLLTFLVILLPLMGLGVYVVKKHAWAQSRLTELEPRYARLRGLDLQRDEIDQALDRALKMRGEYVYPLAQDVAQTGNAVQQKVRDLLTTAGLTVVSSQVLPAKEEKGFDRIPLSVRAEGDLLAVDSALSVLNEQLPVLLLSDVEVRNQGTLQVMSEKVAPRLTLQLTLTALRERP